MLNATRAVNFRRALAALGCVSRLDSPSCHGRIANRRRDSPEPARLSSWWYERPKPCRKEAGRETLLAGTRPEKADTLADQDHERSMFVTQSERQALERLATDARVPARVHGAPV